MKVRVETRDDFVQHRAVVTASGRNTTDLFKVGDKMVKNKSKIFLLTQPQWTISPVPPATKEDHILGVL